MDESKARELLTVAISQIAVFAGNFVGIKIMTHTLGPTGYGDVALGTTIATLINMLVYGPLGQIILRYQPVFATQGRLPSLWHVLRTTNVTIGTCILAITLLVAVLLGGIWRAVIVMSLLFGLFNGLCNVAFSIYQAGRKRGLVAFHQVFDVWGRVAAIAIICVVMANRSGVAALLAYNFAALSLLGVHWLMWRFRREQQNQMDVQSIGVALDSTELKALWAYAAPFALWAIFSAASLFADRWIIQMQFGESAVGLYVALSQVASAPIVLVYTIISQLSVPILFAKAGTHEEKDRKPGAIQHLVRDCIIFLFSTFAIIFTYLIMGRKFVEIFTSSEFALHAGLLPIFGVGFVFLQLGQLFALVGHLYMKTDRYLATFVTNALASVVFTWILSKWFGMNGAAYALLISNLVYLISVVVVGRSIISESVRPVRNSQAGAPVDTHCT